MKEVDPEKRNSRNKMVAVKNAYAPYQKIARHVFAKFPKMYEKQSYLLRDVNFVVVMDAIQEILMTNTSTHPKNIRITM